MNSKIHWSIEIDKILGDGVFLDSIGINNWALSRLKALDAIDKFSALGIAVSGGDVCEQTQTGIALNYDNWFCEKNAGEDELSYIKRSIGKAKEYIENYTKKLDSIHFILVPQV